MSGSEVLEAVAAAACDGQYVVDAQSVSQRCRVRVDRSMAQSAGPAVGVGDQLPQPLPIPALPACPAHTPEYTPSIRHPANPYPRHRHTGVGQTPPSEKLPSRTTQPSPGTGTRVGGDSSHLPQAASGGAAAPRAAPTDRRRRLAFSLISRGSPRGRESPCGDSRPLIGECKASTVFRMDGCQSAAARRARPTDRPCGTLFRGAGYLAVERAFRMVRRAYRRHPGARAGCRAARAGDPLARPCGTVFREDRCSACE